MFLREWNRRSVHRSSPFIEINKCCSPEQLLGEHFPSPKPTLLPSTLSRGKSDFPVTGNAPVFVTTRCNVRGSRDATPLLLMINIIGRDESTIQSSQTRRIAPWPARHIAVAQHHKIAVTSPALIIIVVYSNVVRLHLRDDYAVNGEPYLPRDHRDISTAIF